MRQACFREFIFHLPEPSTLVTIAWPPMCLIVCLDIIAENGSHKNPNAARRHGSGDKNPYVRKHRRRAADPPAVVGPGQCLCPPPPSGQVPPGGGRRVKSGSGRKADLTSVKDLVLGFWSHHLFPFVSRWRNSSALIMSLVQFWRLWWWWWGVRPPLLPDAVLYGPLNSCKCTNWEDHCSLTAHFCAKVTGSDPGSSAWSVSSVTSGSLHRFAFFFFLPLAFFCSSLLRSVA